MNSLILKTVAPIVLHLTLLVSLFLLLYGHNQPGGGFIAGLMTAVGMVLQWVAFDSNVGWRRFNRSWDRIYGSGLILAALVGVFGLLSGAFLKSSVYGLRIPFIGHIEVFTAFLFDLGVYGVVVGVLMTVLTIFSDRRSPLHPRD